MKYFLDTAERVVYAYEEDGSQDDFIRLGLVPLSDDELLDIRAEQEAAAALTPEQLLKSAMDRRDELLAIAALRIAPLQDAVDLDEATTEEAAVLKQWKQYRIAVNRVAQQPTYPQSIEWPQQPIQQP